MRKKRKVDCMRVKYCTLFTSGKNNIFMLSVDHRSVVGQLIMLLELIY